eukprot:scaffold8301_cov184-Cylindrotheca_fusiformis.AAC.14
MPIQRRETNGDSQVDERDDAFVASMPRVAYRWSHAGVVPFNASERIGVIGGRDNRSVARSYASSILRGPPMWNQNSGRHSMRSFESHRWHNRPHHPIGMVPFSRSLGRNESSFTHRVPSSNSESDMPLRNQNGSENPPRVLKTERYLPRKRSSGCISEGSRVVIPSTLIVPKELASSNIADSPANEALQKRQAASNGDLSISKRTKRSELLEGRFDKLDLLCSATLELGPLQDNPAGCSCPKSKCIALYCDCFKAGRRCSPSCSCLDCKNTILESGANGARSNAIQAILARNPRAFTNAGSSNTPKLSPGEQACNCIRSRCLKLYCTCFQSGSPCNPSVCTCVGCLNTKNDSTGARKAAIQTTLEKRPDAFREKSKTKEIGSGCACKNNRCIRKYCECFRTSLLCSKKCSCRDCGNKGEM